MRWWWEEGVLFISFPQAGQKKGGYSRVDDPFHRYGRCGGEPAKPTGLTHSYNTKPYGILTSTEALPVAPASSVTVKVTV